MLSAVGSFGKTLFVDRISVYEFLIYDNKHSIRNCSSSFYVGCVILFHQLIHKSQFFLVLK